MISIFARLPFLNVNRGQPYKFGTPIKRGHLMRVSSLIRAMQISEYLGCKLNPTKGYENDTCIYVKPHVPNGHDFKFEGKPYMDIIDGWGLGPLMAKHPKVPVIAVSQFDYETLSRILPNKIILIPQHHANFERIHRDPAAVKNVGVIGTAGAFPFLPEGLKEGLAERGMNLIEFSKFDSRKSVQDFYKDLYVQIVWRPYRMRLANPLKLVNGASFGVPTIAFEEESFKEMKGYYFPVRTLDEFFAQLDILKSDPHLYDDYSNRCIQKAEEYHIENIAKLYRNLE